MPLQENRAQQGGILEVNDESERKNTVYFKKRL